MRSEKDRVLPPAGPVVEAQNLVKVYSGNGIATPALRGISLRIQRGEFVAIVGPSGSGKSTLLNMIGALDRPTSGRVLIDGVDISQLSDAELARLRNDKIGFVFQALNLIPRMDVLDNIQLPLLTRGVPPGERRARALEVLNQVGLGDKAGRRPSQLSGGEQQRVAIARALVTRPPLLLADEPTGNLDTKTSRALTDLFTQLNEQHGQTVIVITHNLEVASESERIVLIRDGLIEGEKVLRGGSS